jgi:hypothetical protein
VGGAPGGCAGGDALLRDSDSNSPATARRPPSRAQAGAKLTLKLNTLVAAGQESAGVLLEVAHLKSYKHMGQALFRCERACWPGCKLQF